MLNPIQCILSVMALSLGLSFAASAAQAASDSDNSVVFIACGAILTAGGDNTVIFIDPPNFSAVEINKEVDSCAYTMAKMNHYGWRTLDVDYQTGLLDEGKRADSFLLTGITFKK